MSDRKLVHRPVDNGAAAGRAAAGRRPNGTPVDLGVLNNHIGYFARRFQVQVFQDFIRTLAEIDVRPAQYSVLVVVGANPGLSQADLATTLGIERARLVHLLDKLERRGLVERRRAPGDRRSHALHLTREGQKLLKRAIKLAASHEARLADSLGPEAYKVLMEGLRRFGGAANAP